MLYTYEPSPAAEPRRGSSTSSLKDIHGTTSFSASTNTNFSSTFDYVMVFPHVENEQSPYAQYVVNSLLSAGLEVFPYLSVQKDELIVLLRCPIPVLREFADKIDYQMKIDPEELQKLLEKGFGNVKPVFINHFPEVTEITPFEHIYLQFETEQDEKLYWRPPGAKDPFTRSVRLKLVYLMLRASKAMGGCAIDINLLLNKKHILAFFPLHDKSITAQILDRCFDKSVMPWQMPVHDLREYFGEKIALYSVFLGHYAQWLIWPSLIGLGFQLVVWATLDFSSPVLPFYSLVVTVWSIFMLEYWKRQESVTALLWGMTNYEDREQDRPEFKGISMKSYINGEDMTYYPETKTNLLINLSRFVVGIFIVIVIGIVTCIYTLRFYLQGKDSTAPAASPVASILNTIEITIFNIIYGIAATKLTDNENQRTDTMYEDSLIVKMFVFQFINSYGSFFFIAFVAGNLAPPSNAPEGVLGQCGYANCMQPLSINLVIIFGTRLTLTNFLDIFIPYYTWKQKLKNETKGTEGLTLTPPEEDYMLLTYNTLLQSINNYADTAVQYGFSLLFITALPIASLCSLFSTYVKSKLNIWKITTFYQRPAPVGAQDIGTWQTIFNIISVISVPTNAALICFTMDVLWQYSLQGRVWVFIGFQWVLISIQYILQASIPDEDEQVTIQKERMKFIFEKVVEKSVGEDKEEVGQPDEGEEDNEEPGTCCSVQGKGASAIALKSFPYPVEILNYPLDASSFNYPEVLDKSHPSLAARFANNKDTTVADSYLSAQSAMPMPPPPPSAAVYH